MTVNLSALAGAGAQFLDNNGAILSGGKLYSYVAGTTTPQTAYTSVSGATAHTNPIILNSAGRIATGEIWLTAGSNYKFVLYTSANVLIATWDNITGINGTGIATNANNVEYDPPFANAVPITVQAKLAQTVNVKDFGAVSGTTSDQSAAFHAAFDAVKNLGGGTVFANGTYRFTNNLILRDTVSLMGDSRESLVLEMNNCYVTNETGIGKYCEFANLTATITSVNGTDQYGLVLAGFEYSILDITISGFNASNSIGLLMTSVLDGATYRYARNNLFTTILVENCYKGIVLTKNVADPATFGANFNTFNDGYVNGYSVTGIHIEFGEGCTFTGTRCTTSIGSGSIGWLIEDSANTLLGCTADGSFGGTVPGTDNEFGFPHGRDGDLTTVGFKFNTGSNGCILLGPKGDACFNRVTADSVSTMNTINVLGRVGFNRIDSIYVQSIDFSQTTAGAGATSQLFDDYEEGTWTPVFSFNTPGDLALSAVTTNATYTKIGRLVTLACNYTFTPTFTTASGQAKITGIPYTNSAQVATSSVMTNNSNVTYPAGATTLLGQMPASTSANIFLYGTGSAINLAAINASNFTTATSVTLQFNLAYFSA